MNGGQAIVGIDEAHGREPETAASFIESADVSAPAGVEPRSAWLVAMPWVVGLLSLGWVAAALWLTHGSVSLAEPVGLVSLLAAICVVPGMLGVAWLLLARLDESHAARLVAGSREIRAETLALQETVARLAASVVAQRDVLADQARSLAGLGEGAIARLSAIGGGLTEEISRAESNARAVGDAAAGAEAKLAVLLATLPRMREEADALGSSLERVGLGAAGQISGLDSQLVALAERGREAEVLASGGAQKLAAHITRMDATSEAAAAKLDAVTAAMAEEIDRLLDRTAGAVDESRKGIATQGEAMLAMLQAHQAALDTSARESAEALATRIEIVELVIERVAKRLEEQRRSGDGMVSELERWLDRIEERFATVHRDNSDRTQSLAASIEALSGSAEAMAERLRSGDGAATRAISTAETLLIALDAATREIDETMALALARLDQRLEATHARIAATRPDLMAIVTASESTHQAVEAVGATLADQTRDAGRLADGLAASHASAERLDRIIADAASRIDDFAETAAPRLLEALLRVRETASAAADRAREVLAGIVPETAEALERAGAEALGRAAGAGLEAQIASIAEVAEAAVGAASRAADRLERQIDRIGEGTAALDTRLAEVNAAREAHERDSFARRSALLIEALNSASIDLTRSLRGEIDDPAWAAYLRGDRGVFTRRAVRLLDGGEQREVARLYDADAGFREQVNRYVHDFEAMLRAVLVQRDGSPLGITLLSSDVGRLYVALAQAIDRLR